MSLVFWVQRDVRLSLTLGRSKVEGSDRRWTRRGAIAGGGRGERSQVEGSDLRGEIAGGGELLQGRDRMRGAIAGGGERSQVEGSNSR